MLGPEWQIHLCSGSKLGMRHGEGQRTELSQLLISVTQFSHALPCCHLKSEKFIPGEMQCISCFPTWNPLPALLPPKNFCSTPKSDLPGQPKWPELSNDPSSTYGPHFPMEWWWGGAVGKPVAEGAAAEAPGVRGRAWCTVPRECLE